VRIDTGVSRPAVGDQLGTACDGVVVAEARAANVAHARVDPQSIVEPCRDDVAHVRLEHERLESLLLEGAIAAGVLGEVGDASDLEPDEVDRVVRDPLRVRLGEPDGYVRMETEAVDCVTLRGWNRT
jgi:hypothetical protein